MFLSWMLALAFLIHPLGAQSVWQVGERQREIRVDGFLDDWEGIRALAIRPDTPGIEQEGEFQTKDLALSVQALWDEDGLYLALDWQDDVWDVRDVQRREAIWIDSQGVRRERMLFFDNFRFEIWKADYIYTLWTSPRVEGVGPFRWNRLLEGLRRMESASAPPHLAMREDEGRVTAEIFFRWRELKLRPRRGQLIPVSLLVTDSDHPGLAMEAKSRQLKWLSWNGEFLFAD